MSSAETEGLSKHDARGLMLAFASMEDAEGTSRGIAASHEQPNDDSSPVRAHNYENASPKVLNVTLLHYYQKRRCYSALH